MKYFGLTINLNNNPETLERYKAHHQNVWSEVERALRCAGIIEMKIFLLGRRLFMYMETDDSYDAQRARQVYMEAPGVSEWEALMQSLQEPVPEAGSGESWALMESVYEFKR